MATVFQRVGPYEILEEIGRGGMPPDAIRTMLAEGSSAPARLTAPPSGLFLERVYYERDGQGAPPRPATPLTSSTERAR